MGGEEWSTGQGINNKDRSRVNGKKKDSKIFGSELKSHFASCLLENTNKDSGLFAICIGIVF